MQEPIVENILPLFFNETVERDNQGRVIQLKRGVSIQNLTKVFRSTRAFTAFLLSASKRLKKVGFTLKTYKSKQDWYITATPRNRLPSSMTEDEAFILALIATLSDNTDLTVRTIEEEVEDLRITHLQTRKIVESLIIQGLLERTSSNPMRVQLSGLFSIEFSEEDKIKIKSLFQYHFLLGRNIDD